VTNLSYDLFQISASRLLRITAGSELQLRIPAGSAWNIGLKLRVFAFDLNFCKRMIAKRVFLVPKLGNFFQNTRELPKTPGLSKNTRTFQKHFPKF